MNRTCSDLKYILFISDGFDRMFSSLWSYVVILCFLSKISTPLPASNLSRVGRGGERQGKFSSPLLRSRVAPESLRAGYLLPCSVYDFREVLCVEFLYCRIVTGSADGKVGLSILSLVFQCLFVLTLHRGPSNFLVRKREAPKRLYPQNSWFSVTVISRVHLCIARFFLWFSSSAVFSCVSGTSWMETVFGLSVETAKMMPSPQPERLVTGELTNDQLPIS